MEKIKESILQEIKNAPCKHPQAEWRYIPNVEGFSDNCVVNEYGEVYNFRRHKLMRDKPNKDGYVRFVLKLNGKHKSMLGHRLVALAFIANPNNYPIINHIDENKSNNYYKNLEWCTREYNNNYNDNEKKIAEKIYKEKGKTFFVYDLNYNYVRDFKGTRKFAQEIGATSGHVSTALSVNDEFNSLVRSVKGYYVISNRI